MGTHDAHLNDTYHNNMLHNYTQHCNKNMTLITMMLSIIKLDTKCCYAEWRICCHVRLNVVTPSIIMLNVILMSVMLLL